MKQSESIATLAAALVEVQLHMEPVTKDRTNTYFNANYATLDAIMEAVRGPLAGNGLAIVQGGAGPVADMSGQLVGVSVETMLVHKSGEFIASILVMPLDKPSAQAVGSAVTYARRYSVSALLGLATEEDDDGNHATATQLNRPAAAAPAAAKPAPKAAASAPPANEPTCPKCSGAMWDNREGKKNPSAPDWKCKNAPKERGGPGCDGVIWPPKAAAATS